jgi:hypothetical protein
MRTIMRLLNWGKYFLQKKKLGKIYKELAAAGRARCDMPSVPTKMCQVLFSWGLKIVHAFF